MKFLQSNLKHFREAFTIEFVEEIFLISKEQWMLIESGFEPARPEILRCVATLLSRYDFQDYSVTDILNRDLRPDKKRCMIAFNLKYLCGKNQVSISKLSRSILAAPKSVKNWLNGEGEPSATHLMRISKFFEVETDSLLFIDLEKIDSEIISSL
jgi:hypothetical protein